jgi:hypothetical protein
MDQPDADELELDLDADVKEDAKSRKRRLNSELTRALAVLGVKHSTFYSMLNAGKQSQVKTMLKDALQERFDALVENPDLEKEDFNIHLEITDMTTIHESYQYLVKKYVDGNEDATSEAFMDMEELKKRHEENKAKREALQAQNGGSDNKKELSPMDQEKQSR